MLPLQNLQMTHNLNRMNMRKHLVSTIQVDQSQNRMFTTSITMLMVLIRYCLLHFQEKKTPFILNIRKTNCCNQIQLGQGQKKGKFKSQSSRRNRLSEISKAWILICLGHSMSNIKLTNTLEFRPLTNSLNNRIRSSKHKSRQRPQHLK